VPIWTQIDGTTGDAAHQDHKGRTNMLGANPTKAFLISLSDVSTGSVFWEEKRQHG
jgi:hypothetical protein